MPSLPTVLTTILLLTHAPWALSAASTAASSTDPSDVTTGELLVHDDELSGARFPLTHTDVDAEIAGNVAHVVVTQTFDNPYDKKIEAVYVFPLPNRAAVDEMEIRLGERVVKGVIKKRSEARRIYEEAKRGGHVAALLDQERPNIFTQSVANILPGNQIRVRIRYFEVLPYEKSDYTFSFPMVVGPRFIPGSPNGTASERGWASDSTDVPDASRITPPVLKPGTRSGHDISLRVSLDAGAALESLASPSHKVSIETTGVDEAEVVLSDADSIPNKDFVLRYRLDSDAPRIVLLPHRGGGDGDGDGGDDGYFLMLIQPEARPAPEVIAPKEMIFVVDGSGSMSGFPMQKVKEAMRHALSNLNPDDTFQIVRFSNRAELFAPAPLPATEANVQRGLAYVETLSGRGGTIMLEGVRAALTPAKEEGRLRIVSFMTDGYIGNENQILAYLESHLNGARLFPFGVGSSVNRYLLDKMAEIGRGAVEYVLLIDETREPVRRFYDRVRNPYLTELQIAWDGLAVEDVYPKRLPDLFLGQPVVIHGRYTKPGKGRIALRGRLGGENYEQMVDVALPARHVDGEAIGTLWARARIEELLNEQIVSPSAGVEAEITRVALEHSLVSAYTSFVAVEQTIQTGADGPVLVEVPVEMPDGVSYEGVFGGEMEEAVGLSRMAQSAPGRAGLSSYAASPRLRAPVAPRHLPGAAAEPEAYRAPSTSADDAARHRRENFRRAPQVIAVYLSAERNRYHLGEEIVVELTIENNTARTVPVPARLDVAGGTVRFQIVDASWIVLPHPSARAEKPRMVELAPGARVTIQVTLNGEGGYVLPPGSYHIVLVGEPLGLAASNRLTISVER